MKGTPTLSLENPWTVGCGFRLRLAEQPEHD